MATYIRRQCTVCNSEHVTQIDLLLSRGTGCRAIASRFPDLNYQAIWRHGRNHLPPNVRAGLLATGRPKDFDAAKLKAEEGESLLANLTGLRGRLLALLQVAEEADDVRQAAAVHAQLSKNLEVTGRLLNQIGGPVHLHQQNFLISADYLALRHSLMRALRPFPDARAAVARAIKQVEVDAYERRSEGDAGQIREVPAIEHAIERGASNGS